MRLQRPRTAILYASMAYWGAVNISNTWTLPQDGFTVFYRYFRDKISWFEADAVCQFHHANLVTAGGANDDDDDDGKPKMNGGNKFVLSDRTKRKVRVCDVVDNGVQFDAARAFLKELDVTNPVWIGLMRPENSARFTWT
ncbi:conserved hypothetical protein [Culex quinquefasciatus]|uniref:C-type lectin domain-containing protein n=1 Tax=Culex quinquefasciatus TaxID=7176 RepID=B0XFZ1_CULQU|nr:conserved hypothetical protein [Culex quinquefasciatus]|eukprot:XP_001868563.1 conserved hypothetical protein [Culex quinquefasciatus]